MQLPLAVATALLLVGLGGCGQAPPPEVPFERVTFLTVPSFDGHNVPVTVYRPDHATGTFPVPVVLHSHGWGGTRETRLQAFGDFTDAGLGVVSIDMRGHGEARATSLSHLASPRYEGRDVAAVVDYVANLTWVASEAAGDPVVGVMGESYGGAFALLAAASDARVDAVVAENTWNDLVAAMAPNGVPKTAWFASLWLAAAVQGRIHADVRVGFENAIQQGGIPDGAGGAPDLVALFAESSPASYPGGIRVPTLLVQGVNDTLFDFGEAIANHALVASGGGDAALVTHLAGHQLPPGGGNGTRGTRHPCGDPEELALAWMREHLLQGPREVAAACITLDDGTTLDGGAFPLAGIESRSVSLQSLALQAGNLSARAASDLLRADRDTAILGSARLSGTAMGSNGTVYWTLEAVDAQGRVRVANGQVTPWRAGGGPFEVELAAVALHLREDETLRLAVLGHHPLFAAPAAPGPMLRFSDLSLTLPSLDMT